MEPAKDPYKKWGIVLVVFLLILIPSEIALTRPNAIRNFQLSLKLATQEKPKVTTISKQLSNIQKEDHPELYFIDLEYDPLTGNVSKIRSGKFNGDLGPLADKPSSSSGIFNYRLETISANGSLLSSGWISLYETVISTEGGHYLFRPSISYAPGETLNIYLIDNKKIWEEKIK